MSVGNLRWFIKIKEIVFVQDAEGFKTTTETVLAEVRAYREDRKGSQLWANLAAFSKATVLFQFRRIPGVTITDKLFIECDGELFNITSVDTVKGRGSYVEVYCEKVVGSIG